MATTKLTVRHHDFLQLQWTIKNYVEKSLVGLTVQPDPGTPGGTTAIAPAPDACTTADRGVGKGAYTAAMPENGTFHYTLRVEQKPLPEIREYDVTVQELHYKVFAAGHEAIWLGEDVKLSWEVEAGAGCHFKLVTTIPDGRTFEEDVTIDDAGKGSTMRTPVVKGPHRFQLTCVDPTLQPGQALEACPVRTVEVREEKHGLEVLWADATKPSLRLIWRDSALTRPPWYQITVGETWGADRAAPMAKGTDAAGAEVAGQWEAAVEVAPRLVVLHLKIADSQGELGRENTRRLTIDLWFRPPPGPGEAPLIQIGGAPDRSGSLGEVDLPPEKRAGLSPKRRKVIERFLPLAIPSRVGSAAFEKYLEKQAEVERKKAEGHGYSTCGTVSSFLANSFNEQKRPDRYTIGGLAGCFFAAVDSGGFADDAHPAWITARPGLLPKPGDIFLITGRAFTPDKIDAVKRFPHAGDRRGTNQQCFECKHVGVVVETGLDQVSAGGLATWVVAEAGQADNAALYNQPTVGPDDQGNLLMGTRRVAGWVDIDAYVPWDLAFKRFDRGPPKVKAGRVVTFSWSVWAACSPLCTWVLVDTPPGGQPVEISVAINSGPLFGTGKIDVRPSAVGIHGFRLVCKDPTRPEAELAGPEVQVEVEE